MFLHQVAEGNDNYSINDLRNGRVEMKNFNQYFKVDIIENNASDGRTKIPYQLVPSPECAG